MNVAITGSSAETLKVLYEILKKKEEFRVYVLWDATFEQHTANPLTGIPPEDVVNYTAKTYVAECQILSTRRIMDRTMDDTVWIVDADVVTAATMPHDLPHDRPEDILLLGEGVSRFSRKALDQIASDFGSGLDYTGLSVATIEI
jgi:hypothetical protein